ncbi:hypothetical protein ES150_04105 [Enterobacillus tribolii]|nr:hypothetical protein [Enterobacillus tribolii]
MAQTDINHLVVVISPRESAKTPTNRNWTAPTTVDKFCPHDEACSKASGLTPPRPRTVHMAHKRTIRRQLKGVYARIVGR